MTETSPNPSQSDDQGGTKGAPDGETKQEKTEYIKRSEAEEAWKARDKLKDQIKTLKDEFGKERETLQSQLNEFSTKLKDYDSLKRKQDDDEAERKGDIEKLRLSAAQREKELTDALEAEKAKWTDELGKRDQEIATLKNTYLLDNEVLRLYGEFTIDPETTLLLTRDKLELAQDENGRLKPRVKDSTLDVKSWAERELEARGKSYLLKSQRKPGTGTQQQPSSNGATHTGPISMDQLRKMPDGGQKLFSENIDAANEVLRGTKLKN